MDVSLSAFILMFFLCPCGRRKRRWVATPQSTTCSPLQSTASSARNGSLPHLLISLLAIYRSTCFPSMGQILSATLVRGSALQSNGGKWQRYGACAERWGLLDTAVVVAWTARIDTISSKESYLRTTTNSFFMPNHYREKHSRMQLTSLPSDFPQKKIYLLT
jgi:hypothetical protein